MKYITNRDNQLVNKLQDLLADASRACPDKKVAEMQKSNITFLNEDLTEYVLVWFFDGRQVCVHRTINEGVIKLGCDIIRVWERHLPNEKAIEQLSSEIRRMLGHRIKVWKDIKDFEHFALEFKAEGMKL